MIMNKNLTYVYYNHDKASFEEMMQLEYVTMLEAVIQAYTIFLAVNSSVLKQYIFLSLN